MRNAHCRSEEVSHIAAIHFEIDKRARTKIRHRPHSEIRKKHRIHANRTSFYERTVGASVFVTSLNPTAVKKAPKRCHCNRSVRSYSEQAARRFLPYGPRSRERVLSSRKRTRIRRQHRNTQPFPLSCSESNRRKGSIYGFPSLHRKRNRHQICSGVRHSSSQAHGSFESANVTACFSR